MKLSQEELDAARILYDYMRVEYPPEPADVIIGFGTYHLGAAWRAAELWHEGYAPYIIFSGYKNDRHPKAEAEMLRDEAIKRGVPSEVIFTENKASNSGLNITLSYELAKQHGFLVKNRVILVQKPYMTRRAYATAKAQWPDKNTKVFVTSAHLQLEDFFTADGVETTIRSILVDFYCIKAYPAKGWQIPQEVPDKVEAASQYLLNHGHNFTIPV
jgi:uncharacterized SAM-binding protein YcdF (DUF218 family)